LGFARFLSILGCLRLLHAEVMSFVPAKAILLGGKSSASADGLCRLSAVLQNPLNFSAEFRRDVGTCESVGDICREKADLRSAIVAAAFEFKTVEGLLSGEP